MNTWPVAIVAESQTAVSEVVVWVPESTVHWTVSPTWILTLAGANLKFSMLTSTVLALSSVVDVVPEVVVVDCVVVVAGDVVDVDWVVDVELADIAVVDVEAGAVVVVSVDTDVGVTVVVVVGAAVVVGAWMGSTRVLSPPPQAAPISARAGIRRLIRFMVQSFI